ncbi:voltage-dependent T-type calcium channel subunit alpha-1G-like [Ylistrum balloti]|uniref:voltage-dependent T-type calcium channel subunit alpha-1G-like n=1 Tax=Ylistrum balloti TaxID=509963 RepID=UPI002905BD91|nr:voltage-dependent T-type calcium channel subunit alpha-1G-like [Ylistrum balloti]
MAVILLNCVTLGMYQPCEDQVCDTMRCQVLEKFDHFIFAFFAIEMIIKIVAMGLWGKLTYLDDSWNRLDCFIVLAGSIEYGIDSENLSLSAIRTIRVLRPLRAINRIPSMRILVMLLLDTLPMLGNVLLLCFFVFFIFGIIGVQLWAGVLRNRCFLNISENISYAHANLSPYFIPKKLNQDYICSMPGESGMRQCKNFYRYEYEGIRCNGSARPFSNNTPTNDSCINWNQYYTTCMAGDKNPFQGAISFDNIGLAWVAIFQVISLESWVNIMYYVQDAHSFWDWTYFVALIVIGSFFMINLCLVVIATQFSETKKRETERMMQERKRFHSSSTLASNSEPGGCYTEILKYLAHLWRRAKRDIVKFYYEARGRTHPHRKIKPELSLRKRKKKGTRYTKGTALSRFSKPGSCPCCSHRCNYYYHVLNTTDNHILRRNSSPIAPRASPEMSDIESVSSPQRPNFLTVPSMNSMRLSSSDSVNTLALAATDALGSSLLKSSPNHLALHAASVSRTSSFTVSRKHLPSLPETLATHCNKTLASSNTLLQSCCSCSQSKLHHKGCHKGLPEELLDVITDKQLSSYLVNDYDKQSQCNHSSSHDNCDMDRYDIERSKDSVKNRNKPERYRVSWARPWLGSSHMGHHFMSYLHDGLFMVYDKSRVDALMLDLCISVDTLMLDRCSSFGALMLDRCSRVDALMLDRCRSFGALMLDRCSRVDGLMLDRCSRVDALMLDWCSSVGALMLDQCSRCSSVGALMLDQCSSFSALMLDRCSRVDGLMLDRCSSVGALMLDRCSSVGALMLDRCSSVGALMLDQCSSVDALMLDLCSSVGALMLDRFSSFGALMLDRCRSVGALMLDRCRSVGALMLDRCSNVGTLMLDRCSSVVAQMLDLCSSVGALMLDQCRSVDALMLDLTSVWLFLPYSGLSIFQSFMEKVVEHHVFRRGIMFAILINTVGMGIEYHNQPIELTQAVEYSNIVFCVLFALEMLFKLMAYGLFGYIQNGFNVFDGFIVILSIIELLQEDENSGLSVLRTFRLLRILKLVRFMPALRRQLVVMLRTMDNVATFFALLVLFIFIFSVLGMNLFGGKFCWRDEGIPCTCADESNPALRCVCDRANFNSLLWSLVTVFQVLTQEDWNTVLYNGMETTSAWASLYFIALMTFGNYVLFNLLVAILVEGFSTDEEEKKKMRECKVKEVQSVTSETNNNEEKNETIKLKTIDMVQVKINNKEKEKMLAMCPVTIIKEENKVKCTPDPPIITHTAATPMPTPQGSPNEHGCKDYNKATLSVHPPRGSTSSKSSSVSIPLLTKSSSTNLSVRSSPRLSPRVSPCLRRSQSYGSRNSWKGRRSREGDRRYLVPDSKLDSMDTDDDDVFQPNCIIVNNRPECNGHLPLNNQRTLSPQNSIKRPPFPSPRNSIKIRNNSVSSTQSVCNSIILSRQNSFTSHRTMNSLSSVNGIKDDYKQNNLSSDTVVEPQPDEEDEEEDPDAIDEANCSCSWCPEPKGCFKTRKEYSLYLFHPNNRLRRLCHHFMAQSLFDNMILLFIALNCITLGMERPDIPPDSAERMFLTYSNYGFTIVFAVEMTIKVLAKGLLIGKHAYLKSGWNIMDGFLVGISLVDIMISLTANSSPRIFGILRVFRLLRTLRPLRVISRAPGLKLVVQTLLSSLRPIGNIVLICCTFFIIFGILGVQLFKGSFFYCKGPDIQHVKNKTQCLKDPRNIWINQKYNFDNLGQALMALFVLASKDGWVSIMYTGLDAVGVDQQPQINYNEWRLLYFISFLLLVGFFVLNMFVGVVVENFHKCRENQEKEERAIRAAKRSQKMEAKRKSENMELNRPPYWANYSKCRLLIHAVVNSKYFDLAIAGVIGLNVITMAMEYYMMPAELQFALKIFNYFFTSVFIIEATMKIIALGMMRYIKDRWNQLDILIVLLSIVGIILEEMKTNVIPINPTIIRVMRVLRIARVLKLLKMAKSIRALLDTVIQALPNTFPDTLREDCDDSALCLTNCCVSPIIAPVYFVIFVLMAQFVLVNVVVAVLMKHLEETYKYKELDDEVEEELRHEMDDKNKTEIFELKYQESHRMVDEDELLDEEDDNEEEKEESTGRDVNVKEEEMEMMLKIKTPVPSYVRKLKTPICKQASLPPSFTFRPPSNEPPNENEPVNGSLLVPVDITISSFDSSVELSGSSTLDVPLTPSTYYSDNSSYIETNLDHEHSPQEDSSNDMCHIPRMNYLNPNAKMVSPQQKQRFKDRKLVRQKSCDYDSPPITEECVSTRGKLLLSPCQKYREKVSQSQPSLLIVGMEAHRCSKTSKLSECPSRRRLSYLQRSQSSGAEKARVRDRYCFGASPQRPQNSNQHKHTTKGYSVLHPLAQDPIACSHTVQGPIDKTVSLTSSTHIYPNQLKQSSNSPNQLNRSSTCDSQSNDCSTTSDWTGDDAACDEEVRQITGDDTEEEELGDDLLDCFSPDVPGERTLLIAEAPEDEAAPSSTTTDTPDSRQSMIDSNYMQQTCNNSNSSTDISGSRQSVIDSQDKQQTCHSDSSSTDISGSRQSVIDSQDSKQQVCHSLNLNLLPTVPCHVLSADKLSSNAHSCSHSSCHDDNCSHHSNQNNKCNGDKTSVLVHPLSSGEPCKDLEQGEICDRSASEGDSKLYTADKGSNSSGTAKFPVIHFDDPLQVRRRHCSTNSEDGECL